MKFRASAKFLSCFAVAALAGSALLVAAFHSNAVSRKRDSAHGASVATPSAPADQAKWLQAYGHLPLSFIENRGQAAQGVRYVSHGSQYGLFLTPKEAVITLRRSLHLDFSPRHRAASLKVLRQLRKSATSTTAALHLRFAGANPAPQVAGAEQLPGKVNYFIGNDPQKWHTDIPTFAQVKYSQLYPGVDLVFYGHQRKLEYDFVVAPGADPHAIRINLAGARKLRLDSQGDVLVRVTGGEVRLQKPVVYQNIAGQRREIAANYALQGNQISFSTAAYDRTQPLIVDPVLNYAGYLGGTDDAGAGYAIATDSSGHAFIAGQTFATDFPATSALNPGSNTSGTGFVVELDATGTSTPLYSTYLGSSAGDDFAFGVAVSGGDIYVTGQTFGTDFPTAGSVTGFKPSLSVNTLGTSYLAKLDPTMSGAASLVYSTYLGGNNGDFGQAVAADSSGNAYVTGVTYSASGTADVDFPLANEYTYTTQPNVAAGTAFLTRINTTVSGSGSLVYSTYLGGDGLYSANTTLGLGDGGFGVVVDSANNAYLCGVSTSSAAQPFPTSATTFQATPKTGNIWSSAFVSKVNTAVTASGTASLVYSTYLGGSGDAGAASGDVCAAIDLKSGSTVTYLTGYTNSPDFPIKNGFQTSGDAANGAGFVTLLDTSVGTSLNYSTYLGNDFTEGYGIKADSSGNAYVGGATVSLSPALTPTPGALQPTGSTNGDGFIAEINPGGTAADLVYLTYFGGSGVSGSPDQIFGLALAPTPPGVIVTGETSSANFPATNGTSYSGGSTTSEGFAAGLNLVPTLVVSPTSLTFTATAEGVATAAQTVTLTNNTGSAIAFTSATVTGGSPAAADTDFVATNTSCGSSIPAGMSCTLSVVFTATATSESATLTITDGDSSSPQSVALSGTAPAPFSVSPTSLTFSSTAVGTASPAQSVTLTNNSATAVTFTSATVALTSATGAAADFALTPATTCTTIAASGGTCTVSVTYTPSVATTETATLTLVDSDPSSPQVIMLTGNVAAVTPGFTLTAQNSMLMVTQGRSAAESITVTSVGTFAGTVKLACTGAPNNSKCMLSSKSVTLTAGSNATITLDFEAQSMLAPPPPSPRFPPVSFRMVAPILLLLTLLMFLMSQQRWRTRFALAGALLLVVALAGCNRTDTKVGTYPITITGTSSGATTQTLTVTVIVAAK